MMKWFMILVLTFFMGLFGAITVGQEIRFLELRKQVRIHRIEIIELRKEHKQMQKVIQRLAKQRGF
jgi:hypothetical protein